MPAARIGELRELTDDLSGELDALHEMAARLFGHADEPTAVRSLSTDQENRIVMGKAARNGRNRQQQSRAADRLKRDGYTRIGGPPTMERPRAIAG